MLGLDLMVCDNDIVDIGGDLYVKNANALERLLMQLKNAGYQVKSNREDESRKSDGVSVEQMEKNGWSLWFAKLPDIRFGICGSCQELISIAGIRSHGHKCEKCGAVTYYDLTEDSVLTFVFNNDGDRGMFSPQLKMKVHHWDIENGFLYLKYEFLDGGLSVVTGQKAEAYLARNQGKWEMVPEGLKIKYDLNWSRDTAVIEPYDSYGRFMNHKIVKVWKDKQYEEYERLPVPEMFSIYESWHWAPLPVTPTLHSRVLRAAHQGDDKGWHNQDGSPWFTPGHWAEMAKFVRHFTLLDADAFDLVWPRFRRDGPGGIDDIAHFCHKDAVARNEPNIGNVLNALGKHLSGQSLTEQEAKAAKDGLADPRTKHFLGDS